MSGKYARGTSVGIERSREELERILARYGADQFMYAISKGEAAVGFTFKQITYKIEIKMPSRDECKSTPTGRYSRSEKAIDDAWDQAKRQTWRALVLFIKGKLEGVEQGFSSIEKEFLAHVLLADGTKFGDHAQEAIQIALREGRMPRISFLGGSDGCKG